jgi:anthranilate/para-aminobenzoate synthase component I
VTFTSSAIVVRIEYPGLTDSGEEQVGVNPMLVLKQLLASFLGEQCPGLPKFYGGAVGFLGYDMVRFMENCPIGTRRIDLPDSSFMVPGIVLIHDAVQQNLTIVCNVLEKRRVTVRTALLDGLRRIEAIIDRLNQPIARRFVTQEVTEENTGLPRTWMRQVLGPWWSRPKNTFSPATLFRWCSPSVFTPNPHSNPLPCTAPCATSIPVPTSFISAREIWC